MLYKILLHIFIWLGSKLFNHLDIYAPNNETVEGITFSNNEKYLELISEIEVSK